MDDNGPDGDTSNVLRDTPVDLTAPSFIPEELMLQPSNETSNDARYLDELVKDLSILASYRIDHPGKLRHAYELLYTEVNRVLDAIDESQREANATRNNEYSNTWQGPGTLL
ncbi:unnamed protein product [Gongylonema pulchrum]|uniref:Uncharacterized protein n=1 Tax=Gongylonema pulchrum TaxID=637853 RepID=A0A183DKG2_9BILA|nr:unnamed protein product [Gongylonema pulchrum]